MKSQLPKFNMPTLIVISATISLALSTAAYAQWGSLGNDAMSSGGAGNQSGGNSQKSSPYAESSAIMPNQIPPTPYAPSAPGIPNSSFMPYVSPTVPNGGFASYAPLAPVPKGIKVNAQGLPPTTLDSFVAESGFDGSIYGDEGIGLFGPPPANGLSEANAINAGIRNANNRGLTTGHGSYMPDASGVGWSMSGSHERRARRIENPRHVSPTPVEPSPVEPSPVEPSPVTPAPTPTPPAPVSPISTPLPPSVPIPPGTPISLPPGLPPIGTPVGPPISYPGEPSY